MNSNNFADMANNSGVKKILYVENGIGYGGAIICLRHLVRNLDRDRFMPMVVTGRTGPQYQEIANEALWKHILDRYLDTVGLKAKAASIEWLTKLPALRFLVDQIIARADDLCNFLPFFTRLLWTAWRFDADLIHANNEPLCNRAALLVAKILTIPSICHVRGNPSYSRLSRWSYSLVDQFVSVSQWVAESMQQNLAVPSDKISVVYDGIELDKLDLNADGREFRQQFDIPTNAFAIGLVGLLIPWKGQELFIDAAKILSTKLPNLKMLIIGGTPDDCAAYENRLRSRVRAENLAQTVVFTGHVTKMETVYNGLDIVVSASTEPEPLGTVVIETMAMGKALVAPNHGGGAEMIIHNETGLLFEPGSSIELANALTALFNDKKLRITIASNARSHALKAFSVISHAENIQNIYERVL